MMLDVYKGWPAVTRLLDFSDCTTYAAVHGRIREELELPAWYGENLDALWDSLTGIMYVPADITVIYRPRTQAAAAMRPEVEDIIRVLEEARDRDDTIHLTVHCDPAS